MRIYTDDQVKEMLSLIDVYDAAAKKFIDKVESGCARSVETYADLKGALALSTTLKDARKICWVVKKLANSLAGTPSKESGRGETQRGAGPKAIGYRAYDKTDCYELTRRRF